ncbi:RDD family protein [Flavihumibacter sp. R14]|nr:RDD family protein [Flavihumibacter soli]
MADYLIVINGKPQGPYPLEQLKELGLQAGSFVKTPQMDDYKEAHEVPELRELLNLKARHALPQYFATLDVRLLAVIIDLFIIFAVFAFIVFIVMLFLAGKEAKIAAAVSGLVIIPLTKLIYGAIMEASTRQATYGKLLMGIKVTDEAGERITSGQAYGRNFSKLICILTLGVGYLIGFFDKRQQCLHDKIAGTLVIKDRLL